MRFRNESYVYIVFFYDDLKFIYIIGDSVSVP
jgi:hypothetical protein